MSEDNVLGNKITTLREALGLSQEELAERCGAELGTIAGLENGELPPSLAPLMKISRSLGVRLGTLLDDADLETPIVINEEQAEITERIADFSTKSDAGTLTYYSLAKGRVSRHMDPFIITLEPSDETVHELKSHEGEEFLYGLEGQVEIAYGNQVYILNPGESMYYDPVVPHQVRAHNNQRARFLAVVYNPM